MIKTVKQFLVAAGLCLSLHAQPTLGISVDQPFVDPGNTVTVSIIIAGTGITAVQWDLTPAMTNWSTPLANKSLTCNANRCILAGLNQDEILPGVIASATVQVSATTQFALSAPVASDKDGLSLPIAAGAIVEVALYSPFDANKDGAVDTADVQTQVNMALTIAACRDVDGDGFCTVMDVQRVVNSVLGV